MFNWVHFQLNLNLSSKPMCCSEDDPSLILGIDGDWFKDSPILLFSSWIRGGTWINSESSMGGEVSYGEHQSLTFSSSYYVWVWASQLLWIYTYVPEDEGDILSRTWTRTVALNINSCMLYLVTLKYWNWHIFLPIWFDLNFLLLAYEISLRDRQILAVCIRLIS